MSDSTFFSVLCNARSSSFDGASWLTPNFPVLSWKIPAGTSTAPGYVEFEFKYAKQFATGIGVAISTAQATFTDAATAAEHETSVEYA